MAALRYISEEEAEAAESERLAGAINQSDSEDKYGDEELPDPKMEPKRQKQQAAGMQGGQGEQRWVE